jgi:Dihydroorotate dehydrogenase
MYELVYRVLLRRLPAETAHAAGFWLIRAAGTLPGVTWLLRRWLAPRDPVLRVRALGLDLPGPLGLAAGFDKDARGADALGALGFAFIEVGTVTAQAQPGNPQPRDRAPRLGQFHEPLLKHALHRPAHPRLPRRRTLPGSGGAGTGLGAPGWPGSAEFPAACTRQRIGRRRPDRDSRASAWQASRTDGLFREARPLRGSLPNPWRDEPGRDQLAMARAWPMVPGWAASESMNAATSARETNAPPRMFCPTAVQ